MTTYNVSVAPAALTDISDIADFYSELVDEESSQRFIDDVFDTIASLDTFPESHTYFDKENELYRVLVKNHKVSVVYVVDNGVYEVLAFGVFHASGKPNSYTQKIARRLKELE
jgi:plasmid stabilization system protein ParE